jgi:hypothetical protein
MLVGLAFFTVAPAARADVPPLCTQFDNDTNCAAADLGKACPSGGNCVSVSCDTGGMGNPMMLTKCEVCPSETPDTAKVCTDFTTLGKACGNGGTCTVLASWCATGNKFACALPNGAGGSGGSGGSAGAGTGGSSTAGTGGSGTAGSGTAGTGTAGAGIAGTSSAGASASAGGTQAPAASGDSGGGGCAVGPVGKRGAAAALMTLIGILGLAAGRRRSRA